MGLVPSLGFKTYIHPKKGKVIFLNKIAGKIQSVRTKSEKSILIQGPMLFNELPRILREFEGKFEIFKAVLDIFLEQIPDRLCLSRYYTDNKNIFGKGTNSLIHGIGNLRLSEWEPPDTSWIKKDTNI